jgi:type I restriction enzyme S subunit
MELAIENKFKQTDIGLIPSDWEVKLLKNVAQFENGKAHETFIDDNGDFVVVNSKFISSEGKESKHSSIAFSPLDFGDIVMVMSDIPNGKALAKCYFIEKDRKYTLNQRICSFKTETCDNHFLFRILNLNKYFLAFDSGTGQTNLKKQEVLDCPIPLPPTKAEQTAIATALSDADNYISSIENLIAKKQNIKQGAMQKLLSTKKDWVVKKLGELLHSFQNGYGFSAEGYVDDGIPIVTMAQIGLDGSFQFDESKINYWKISDFNSLKDFHLKNGDVIIEMTDVTPEKNLIGRMAIVNSTKTLLLNQRVGLLRLDTSKINSVVLCCLSNMKRWRSYSIASASLGVQANIGTKDILNGQIELPSIEEQTLIATFLSDMDAEIAALEKQLAKARNIKQGMMQKLLTGKIRLV